MPEEAQVAIMDIPTIQAFDRAFIERFIESFERTTHYIRRLPNGNIRLTDNGRDHCSEFI